VDFEHVLVVGAGQMGGGIAQVVAASGRRVSLHDAAPGATERGLATMRRSLEKLAGKGGAEPDEVLSRVERYGRASAIAVRLEFRPDEVELAIRDDGIDLNGRESGGTPAAHFGLRVLERRLEKLGGRLVVERSSPRGVLVKALVPA